jgi:putative membrane protein
MAHPIANSALELDTATKLAYERTRLAYENTMMAWVRTATSLITFGFSVYKFFQLETGSGERVGRLVGPREFAILLIAAGLVSLLLGTVHHVRSMRQLRVHDPALPRSLAAPLGALISLLGLVALIAVIFRQ